MKRSMVNIGLLIAGSLLISACYPYNNLRQEEPSVIIVEQPIIIIVDPAPPPRPIRPIQPRPVPDPDPVYKYRDNPNHSGREDSGRKSSSQSNLRNQDGSRSKNNRSR